MAAIEAVAVKTLEDGCRPLYSAAGWLLHVAGCCLPAANMQCGLRVAACGLQVGCCGLPDAACLL
eukprot:365119-Chlamydomonas_euryale.AAC.14